MSSQTVLTPTSASVLQWPGIKEFLREKLGEREWDSWIRHMRLLRVMPCSHAYAAQIADLFQRRRSSCVLVSPLDWLLIEVWAAAGIPRTAIERGIGTAFERYQRHDLVRQINSISFCANEVLRAAKDVNEASVGTRKTRHPRDYRWDPNCRICNNGRLAEKRYDEKAQIPTRICECVTWPGPEEAMFEDVGQTLLVALPPSGRQIFATLQSERRLFAAAELAGMGLAFTIYPDAWQKAQAQERFGQELNFLDEETK